MKLVNGFYGFVINGILLLILLSFPFNTLSQTQRDTLKEVKVKARHNLSSDVKVNEFSPGQKVQSLDSALLSHYQGQSMATLLAQQAQVFVKSYGFNGLATLSFRGASSSQSAVLWNGVPIQNAALGLAERPCTRRVGGGGGGLGPGRRRSGPGRLRPRRCQGGRLIVETRGSGGGGAGLQARFSDVGVRVWSWTGH